MEGRDMDDVSARDGQDDLTAVRWASRMNPRTIRRLDEADARPRRR
jgi:hypothetical protein